MAHPRTLIRNAIVAALTDATDAEERVYASQVYPYSVLPAIAVFTPNESVIEDMRTIGTTHLDEHRAVNVEIELRDKAATNASVPVDAALDNLASDVELLLQSSASWGPALHYDYESMSVEYMPELEQPVAIMRLVYRAVYKS